MRSSALLVFAVFAVGCAVDSTEPRNLVPPQPRFAALAPPSDLPNVVRYGAESGFGVIDTQTDLWAFAGFPYDISTTDGCGGSAHFDTFYFKDAGQFKGVIHEIAKGDNLRLSVYRFSTFGCDAHPIAIGTGTVQWHDSDFFTSGSGTESFGVHIYGTVSLTNGGGTATLDARNHWQYNADGPRLIFRRVTLK